MIKAKAALLYAPQTIRVEEVTLPDCGPGEVIVRLKKATLCPTDIKKYHALKPDVEAPLRETGPYILALSRKSAQAFSRSGWGTPWPCSP